MKPSSWFTLFLLVVVAIEPEWLVYLFLGSGFLVVMIGIICMTVDAARDLDELW